MKERDKERKREIGRDRERQGVEKSAGLTFQAAMCE